MPTRANTNKLTAEEAAHLAESIADADTETSVELLLLCRALTDEADHSLRWDMLVAISVKLGAYLPGFQQMQEEAMAVQLGVLRRQMAVGLVQPKAKKEKGKARRARQEAKA